MRNYENFNPVQFDENRIARALIAFVVTGTIERTPYMESSKTFEKTHIVYAINEDDAEQKFVEHYRKKTSEYSVYYNVYSVDVSETLF